MRRTDLIAIMDAAKAANGGAEDFTFEVSAGDVRSADTILRHLKENFIITSWSRERGSNSISVTGYTGD